MMQSILRQVNFRGANLLGASFFDADLTSKLLYFPASNHWLPISNFDHCPVQVKPIILTIFIFPGADFTDADLRGADFSLTNVAKVANLYNLQKND